MLNNNKIVKEVSFVVEYINTINNKIEEEWFDNYDEAYSVFMNQSNKFRKYKIMYLYITFEDNKLEFLKLNDEKDTNYKFWQRSIETNE